MASQTQAPVRMQIDTNPESAPIGRRWSRFVIISGILLAVSIIVGIIVILHVT